MQKNKTVDSPEIQHALNSSLVLNSMRTRKKRIFTMLRSTHRRKFNFSQQFLRISFIILILIALLTSFSLLILIGHVFIGLNYNCPLYSRVNSANRVSWGSPKVCEYTIGVSAFNVCYCIVSLFFFIMFNMKDLMDSDYFLLIPWVALTTLNTLLVLISACLITSGLVSFCDSFQSVLACKRFSFVEFTKTSLNEEDFYFLYLVLSMTFSWILFVFMVLIDANILARIIFIFNDFNFEMKANKILEK